MPMEHGKLEQHEQLERLRHDEQLDVSVRPVEKLEVNSRIFEKKNRGLDVDSPCMCLRMMWRQVQHV